MNIESPEQNRCILSVFIFGSHARGDADAASDMDICVFAEVDDFSSLLELKKSCARHYGVQEESITLYARDVALLMARSGSLFLWHLHLEGHLQYDVEGFAEAVFQQLQPFGNYEQALSHYELLLDDVRSELTREGSLSELDLHVLFTIVRNVCILLNFWAGKPAFGRASAYRQAKRRFPRIPVDTRTFGELSLWHLEYARGSAHRNEVPPSRRCKGIVNSVDELLGFAWRKVV